MLVIFFFVSHFGAVRCLSNQFLTCLKTGCSRAVSHLLARGRLWLAYMVGTITPSQLLSQAPRAPLMSSSDFPAPPTHSLGPTPFCAGSLLLVLGQRFEAPISHPGLRISPPGGWRGSQPQSACSCLSYGICPQACSPAPESSLRPLLPPSGYITSDNSLRISEPQLHHLHTFFSAFMESHGLFGS